MSTDRIEKRILLHAPLERVWQAISDCAQFGHWFGISFDGPFKPGTRVGGKISMTQVDPEIAKLQQPHLGKRVDFWIERVDPMRSISFRWHPYAVSPDADYSKEPTTLIEFTLQAIGNDTQLKITESGFDLIPLERRADAMKANEGGWSHQVKLIEKYLATPRPG
jgi:uncharacterized protein YndB with AHSA1/START domain